MHRTHWDLNPCTNREVHCIDQLGKWVFNKEEQPPYSFDDFMEDIGTKNTGLLKLFILTV